MSVDSIMQIEYLEVPDNINHIDNIVSFTPTLEQKIRDHDKKILVQKNFIKDEF